MTRTYKIKTPVTDINAEMDDQILDQLPASVFDHLGDPDGSGFDLNLHQRELFFEFGVVSYVLGSDKATVSVDQAAASLT